MSASVRSLAAAVALAAGTASLAGCGAEPVSGPSLVLSLASPDTASDPNGPAIQHFAAEVARLSEGTIRIEPAWDVTPPGSGPDWDQQVGRWVAGGRYDLGLVPGRAWDELGVTSLRALDTPFLVTNQELLTAVLDSELREDLLSGLPEAGVVGLDMLPGELRHPFGFRRPLRTPDDFRGEVVRAPTSATTRAFFEALGARVVDDDPDMQTQRGMESSYAFSVAEVATGNLTLFAKTETLVMDLDVRDRLRSDQWELLRRAAAGTRAWVADRLPSDAEQAEDFCARGGRIVAASEADRASLEPASHEVRSMLAEDDQTRRLIEEIESLRPAYPDPDPLVACPEQDPAAADDDSDLNGVYEADVSLRAMLAAGVNRSRARENAAHYTWTLEDGTWHYLARATHFIQNPEDTGYYDWDGELFTFHWPEGRVTARLDIGADGTIRFRDVLDELPQNQAESEVFYGSPWRRVGDLDE